MTKNASIVGSDDKERALPECSVASGRVGDWLLAFPAGSGAWPSRTPDGSWIADRRGDGWCSWVTAPDETWQGMPRLVFEIPGWSIQLLGELFGARRPVEIVTAVVTGEETPDALNGHFLLVAWNRLADEWHIWTSRHATLHAYLATNGTRAAMGTYLPSVAAVAGRSELDWEGLTSFFGFGFFAGDRTHYKATHILRPARHYRLDGHGRILAEDRYWHWNHALDARRSYDETLEEFAALFAAVMDDLTSAGRVAVPISGGLDSRSTVATLPITLPDRGRFWAFSYGYQGDSIETQLAGRIAASRSLPFSPFIIQPYLFERLNQVVGATEGFQDVTLARQAAISADIRRHADAVIAAHWGDVWLDDMGLAEVPAGSLSHEQLVDRALAKFTKTGGWLLDTLCRSQLGAATPQDILRGFIDEEASKIGGIEEPDFFIKALKTEQWSARWTTASIRMFQAAAFPRLPFYDTRLSDFFATVPTDFVAGRRMQIDYLKRFAPDLAAVPWQETGSSLYKVGKSDPGAVLRRAFNKARRVARGHRVIERNWEVQFLSPAGRRGIEHWLLQPGLALHEFAPPRQLTELVETFFAAPWTGKRSYPVAMLLTFSAWLELQRGRAGMG